MNKVLILTYEEDLHAESVCNFFKDKKIEYFRINTDKLIENYRISFDSNSGLYIVANSDKTITIDEGWNIWNRRVMDPEIPKDTPKELEEIIFTETKRTWEGLLFTHKGKVVNRPQANFAANNKIDQLCFAKNYGGIDIPETILTNNSEIFIKFYNVHRERNHKICHKLQKAALVKKDNGEYLTTYNNIVNEENMQYSHLIKNNPSLFQTYIKKEYELRITALENKVIGIAIHSQDSELSKIDFRRYDFKNVRYELVDLPINVSSFCSDMIKHYNLFFGEFDFIFTKDGKYVFLELNPNGQWLWLELKSGYNLTKDVAENLL
ncbi:MAG: hypothetical protein V1663_03520 [archaeon]